MKVKDLITKLQGVDPELTVLDPEYMIPVAAISIQGKTLTLLTEGDVEDGMLADDDMGEGSQS